MKHLRKTTKDETDSVFVPHIIPLPRLLYIHRFQMAIVCV